MVDLHDAKDVQKITKSLEKLQQYQNQQNNTIQPKLNFQLFTKPTLAKVTMWD